MSIVRAKIEELESNGYQQLIQRPLPALDVLEQIQKNPTLESEAIKDPLMRQLVTNMRAMALEQKEIDPNAFFMDQINAMVTATQNIQRLIGENKIKPLIGKTAATINRMSQRLFLKDGTIHFLRYRHLIDPENHALPEVANNLQGIFAVLLGRKSDGTYVLEHRINHTPPPMSGHPKLVDDENESVIIAGEEYILKGGHKLSSDQTGNFYERVQDILRLTEKDQEAIMNMCFAGLAREFYRVRLIANTGNIDEDAYKKVREAAGINTKVVPLTPVPVDVRSIQAEKLPASPGSPLSALRRYSVTSAPQAAPEVTETSAQPALQFGSGK